jgi:hypothetical protein
MQQDVFSAANLLNQRYTFSATIIDPGVFGLE